MKKLILFFVLFSSTFLFPQTWVNESNVNFFPQGYGIKLLNSSGSSSINNDISNIGFMNPASISGFRNYSIGLSYQINSSIDEAWVAGIGFDRIYDFYPQSFGGMVKWDEFSFGLGFGQKYNGSLDIGKIQVTSVPDPDGTSELITPILEKLIHSYSISVAYSLNKLLETSNDFSLGFRYNLNHFTQYEQIGEVQAEAGEFFHSFNIGFYSSFNLDQTRNISLGLCYETKSEFSAEIEFDSGLLASQDSNITRPPGYYRIETPALFGETAAELKFDIALDATTQLKFLSNLTTVFWETETNFLKDQIEFSASAVYNINKMFTPSLGFYFTDHKYKEEAYSFQRNSELNAFFITAGLKLNYNNFSADFAIADSHLFSGDYRKQTIGKIAIGVQL